MKSVIKKLSLLLLLSCMTSVYALDKQTVQMARINGLLKEGMNRSVTYLDADDRFLPFVFLLGTNMVNREAFYSDEKAYESEGAYKEAVNDLMNTAAGAAGQKVIEGFVLFAHTNSKVGGKSAQGISVLIESEGVVPRQLFYSYSKVDGELKVANPIEMTYEGVLFK